MRAESVASSKSRGSKYGSYRVKAKTSQIDETLFASPKKAPAQERPKRETVQGSGLFLILFANWKIWWRFDDLVLFEK